jgi:hypothetical protein
MESAVARGAGLVQIGTNVNLYRAKAAAARHMTMSVNDSRELVGKPLKEGAVLERSATFRRRRIADEAAGATFDIRIEGFTFITRGCGSVTVVCWRVCSRRAQTPRTWTRQWFRSRTRSKSGSRTF